MCCFLFHIIVLFTVLSDDFMTNNERLMCKWGYSYERALVVETFQIVCQNVTYSLVHLLIFETTSLISLVCLCHIKYVTGKDFKIKYFETFALASLITHFFS